MKNEFLITDLKSKKFSNYTNKKSGIYQITNIINNKKYIGSSKNLNKRLKGHFNRLNKNIHCNNYLQNSYNKNSKYYFTIKILSFCPPEYRYKLEQWFLDNYINWDIDYNFKNVIENTNDSSAKGKQAREYYKKRIDHFLSLKTTIYEYCRIYEIPCKTIFRDEFKKYCTLNNLNYDNYKLSKVKKIKYLNHIEYFIETDEILTHYCKRNTLHKDTFRKKLKEYCIKNNLNYNSFTLKGRTLKKYKILVKQYLTLNSKKNLYEFCKENKVACVKRFKKELKLITND